MRHTRLLVAIAVVVVLAAAAALLLVGRGSDQPSGQPSAAAAASATTAPTPPSAATPTTADPSEAFVVANTGDDAEVAFRGIIKAFNWLSWHPQATSDVLSQIYDSKCPCFAGVLAEQRRLARRGWRYADEDKGMQIVELRTFARRGPDVVTLAVVDRQGKQIVIDKAGKVVQTGDGWPPTPRLYTLHRGTDGRWRVTGILAGGGSR
jgi:predicted lipid-binding transport protein (Tim44 family)